MSRVGKLPIQIPDGVSVTVDKNSVSANGPKGTLSQFTMPNISVVQVDNMLVVKRTNDEPKVKSKHGLMRALLQNMVKGVAEGYSKKLEINGVGYKVSLEGSKLKFNLGFSHGIDYELPEGITATVDQNIITIHGISKQLVGQVSSEIRALKKPEPYKGKGISYKGERILRKSGKSGKEKTV